MITAKMWYLYKTINRVNNKFYIGVHHSNDIENDKYLGSGPLIQNAIKKYGRQNFIREILGEFDDRDEAFSAERTAVSTEVINDRQSYNLKLGGAGGWVSDMWLKEGEIFARPKSGGQVMKMHKHDPRISSGEYVYFRQGKILARDHSNNKFMVDVNDPRIGKSVFNLTDGTTTVRDVNGNTFRVSVDDPRLLCGEVVGHRKGTTHTSAAIHKLQQHTGSKNSRFRSKWMFNDELQISTTVKHDDVRAFTNEGWELGRKRSYKGKTK